MKKYDISSVIGIIGGIILLTTAIIVAGSLQGSLIFISLSSVLTVIGGLVASIMVNFNMQEIKDALASTKKAFVKQDHNVPKLVEEFVELATMARREGLLSLDNKIDEIDDDFIKKGILLTVDGLEAEVIKEILAAEVVSIEEKQKIGKIVYEKAGELAPAWGMIGTLIGLILMLQNLDDPKTIGPSMALALITTFYGAVLANLFFIPLSGKLANRVDNEVYVRNIMIEGILGVQSGQNPKLLKEKLEVFVDKEGKEEGEEEEEATATVNEEVAY